MNEANKKLRIGVLGLGEGRSVISAVQSSGLWKLGAICDLNEQLCRERAEEFHLSGYCTDYQEMLRDESIDVIGIYTPDQLMPNISSWRWKRASMWSAPSR